MRRVLFHISGLPIYSYAAMLYVGAVFGTYAQLYVAMQLGLDPGRVLAAALILLTFALLGARLLHVVPNWRSYRKAPRRVLHFATGGASMYGGLLLGLPISIPVLAALELPFGIYWDTCSFTMLIGMIVTRAGCLLNGCCSGRPTSEWWGIHLANYKGERRRRVPLQILEGIWGLVVLAMVVMYWGHLPFEGAMFLVALGTYGAGRLALESLREEQDRIMGFSLHKALSTGFIVLATSVFVIDWLR